MNKFKYLGEEGGSEEAARARVSAAWDKWRDLSGVISDKKMPRKLKINIYSTVVRPVLLYGAECWTKGVKLRDKVKGMDIRKELGVNSI